jgi:uncharacterized membrane protein YfcA
VGAAVAKVVVGFVSGILSGMFGIGGGLITTPAIRLLLGYPALVAVGTPLPVILPGALTGAVTYWRRGSADIRAGVLMGLLGSAGSVAGALLSQRAGGTIVLLATALLIGWAAADMLLQHRSAVRADAAVTGENESDEALAAPGAVIEPPRHSLTRLALIGVLAGVYSGFLGLGGGFVIVPALTRYLGMPVKRAIGTSLVTVAVLAVPGTITHYLLGHIDPWLALLLAVGVVPGAMIGARLTQSASDRTIRLAFAGLLAVVGVWLTVSEIAGLHL